MFAIRERRPSRQKCAVSVDIVRVHILLPGLQVILDVLLEITQLCILVEQSAGALEVISLRDITHPCTPVQHFVQKLISPFQ